MSLRAFNFRLDQAKQRKKRFGEEYWGYGGLTRFNGSNVNLAIWCIDSYINGVKRILPWNNYGRDDHYEIPNENAILYPGNRFGFKRPTPSSRLKAVRRGVEILNYLATFKKAYNLNDIQLKAYVEKFISFQIEDQVRVVNDAGSAKYKENSDKELERLKKHLLCRLLEKA